MRFSLGEEGAHQIVNNTDGPRPSWRSQAHGRPDIVVYPDSDKIGVGERLTKAVARRFFGARTRSTIGRESAPKRREERFAQGDREPRDGERIVFLRTAEETNGELLEMDDFWVGC